MILSAITPAAISGPFAALKMIFSVDVSADLTQKPSTMSKKKKTFVLIKKKDQEKQEENQEEQIHSSSSVVVGRGKSAERLPRSNQQESPSDVAKLNITQQGKDILQLIKSFRLGKLMGTCWMKDRPN